MLRICLFVASLYFQILSAVGQKVDSTAYVQRKLKLEEVNFVSSYYKQNGNNSAVTGGVGTEKLMDLSNFFDLKFIRYDQKKQKINLEVGLGLDYYTSASSDNIDPNTISSASGKDVRFYPSVNYNVTDESGKKTLMAGASFSIESDYISYGISGGFSRKSDDRSLEFTSRAQLFFDRVKIILPIELRTLQTGGVRGAPNQYDYPWKHRNTFSNNFSLSKIINPRLQMMLLFDPTYQNGKLGLPFHRIYFKDGSVTAEKLPDSRFKIPIGVKANYFFGDAFILRTCYRYYKDDWGLVAHTVDLETSVKFTPFFSVTPFYRFYTQTGIDYFAGIYAHEATEKFYSSNYDLSELNSSFFGAGFRYAPSKGLLGKQKWNMLEVRYGHYRRSNGLYSNIISLHLKHK